MKNSAIDWTDHTINFWWGCQKVDVDCQHCFADTWASRFGKSLWGSPKDTTREIKKAVWKDIKTLDNEAKKDGVRRKMFVMSMGDFLEDHPALIQSRIQAKKMIEQLEWSDVLMLTKRPGNAYKFLGDWWDNWPQHVWFGISAGNQKTYDERIPYLLNIPAKIRFLSLEPLLGFIDLKKSYFAIDEKIHWVILGGESGTNFRNMELAWVSNLLPQCANIPVFIKQDSGIIPGQQGRIPDHLWSRKEFPTQPESIRQAKMF